MLPTFWEQYGAWLILATAVLVVGMVLIVWMVTRPKPVVPTPWSVQARRELEPLRQLPEDGMLLSRVSQILRHHIAAGFGLSSDEATTSEFCRSLVPCEKIGPELAVELSHFLKECDLRKFAAAPPPSRYDAVGRSLKIIEAAENRLKQVNSVAASTGNSDSSGSARDRQEQSVAGA
jgi:hypothetical protein